MAYVNHNYETSRDDCRYCGDKLFGEQSQLCSASCRSKEYYHARKKNRGWKVCELCGERFPTFDMRRKRCEFGEDTLEGERCWELQNAEAAAIADAIDARDFPECLWCGDETEYEGHGVGGRHRKYCQDKCRVAAYRARKRARASRVTQEVA